MKYCVKANYNFSKCDLMIILNDSRQKQMTFFVINFCLYLYDIIHTCNKNRKVVFVETKINAR